MSIILKTIQYYSYFSYRKFISSLRAPRKFQIKVLNEILKGTNGSDYRVKFPEVSTLNEFQKHLPIVKYEDIHGIALTKKSPLFFEETSGSSGKKKKIPYTKSLLNSFTRMFTIWTYDLLKYGPKLNGKKIYFSISPQFQTEDSEIRDDSDYIQGPLSFMFNRFLLVPPEIKYVKDPFSFFHILSLYFIKSNKLEIISVWSPTFLISILNHIKNNTHQLINDLNLNTYTYDKYQFDLPKTDNEEKKILLQMKIINFQKLFPSLKLISCWDSGQSKAQVKKIIEFFPDTLIQGKGLLATEAPLTVPILNANGFVPLIGECFFEFIDLAGEIFLIDEIKKGKVYTILISQKSGLLRYDIGDRVKVKSHFYNTPCLEFIGRSDNISDLVGEKLNESFCEEIFKDLSLNGFHTIIPMNSSNQDSIPYYLILSSDFINSSLVQEKLCDSFHYYNAIELKQLGPIRTVQHQKMEELISSYFVNCKGMNLGDIKPRLLLKNESCGSLAHWINRHIKS